MRYEEEIDGLLIESGAVLVRQSRHRVYRIPNYGTFVAPHVQGQGDPRGPRNALSDLRRLLQLERPAKPARSASSHRRKSLHPLPTPHIEIATPTVKRLGFAEALRAALHPSSPPHSLSTTHADHDITIEPPVLLRRKLRRRSQSPEAIYTPSPEVLARANEILAAHGDEAMHEFLNQHRHKFTLYTKQLEAIDMSKLDELVAIARKELKNVDAQKKQTLGRKDATEQALAKIRMELEAINIRETDLSSFIETYELAVQQCSVVENLAQHLSSNGHHHRTGSGKAVIAVSMNLLTNGTREIKADDVFRKCKHDGVTVEKSKIASALIYEANKPDGMIERIRTGVYARREVHVNGAAV